MILLQTSVTLGLVVLIGVPAADAAASARCSRPLQRRSAAPARADGRPVQHRQRHRRRPAGAARHRRRAGLPRPLPPRVADQPARPASQVARLQSVLDALQVLPARHLRRGRRLARRAVRRRRARSAPGELVAFYGYSAFLMIPLRTATEYANKLIRGRVAAAPGLPGARARARGHRARATPPPSPAVGSDLYDAAHRAARPRRACSPRSCREQPDESAALADRLGLAAARSTTRSRLGGVPLTSAAPGRGARAGSWSPTPARRCSPGRLARPARRHRRAASVDAARSTPRRAERHPRGAARRASTRGRRARPQRSPAASGSGWCSPARCSADPEVLVLVEPTSRGRRAHRGPDRRPAAATTAPAAPPSSPPRSPLMLDAADEVAFLADGRVVADRHPPRAARHATRRTAAS